MGLAERAWKGCNVGMMEMTARQLGERLRAPERLILLDVREPHEREFARIPAPPSVADLHIRMTEITSRVAELRGAVDDEAAPIVVYCHHGVRSAHVAEWLRRQGFAEVWNLEGGIDAYSVEVDPGLARYI